MVRETFSLECQTLTESGRYPKDSNVTRVVLPLATDISPIIRRRMCLSFLKIGSVGFGGGMAVISLMEGEFVGRLGAIPSEEFVTGVALSQILGAFPVNAAVFVGYRRFGVSGALLAVAAFLLPSVILVTILSYFYFHFHTLPGLANAVAGLSPVVIALIISATWSIGRKLPHTWLALLVGSCALVAGVLQVNPIWALLAGAAAGYFFTSGPNTPSETAPLKKRHGANVLHGLALVPPYLVQVSTVAFTFLKIGLAFFGGGFVLIPLLRDRLVSQMHWLTPTEFLDGLAISSLTPGPIAVIATFVGFHRAGIPGALVATVALFTPGILLMLWISHEYGRFRDSQRLKRLMSGLNPATVGLILSAAVLLSKHAIRSWRDVVLLAFSIVLLVRMRWHPAVVLAIGATVGYLSALI